MPGLLSLHLFALGASCVFALWIAWVDFKTLTISNRSVLIMLGLALLVSVTRQPASIMWDLALGGFLFLVGFLFWLMGAMGAGDVKLYLPLGIALGIFAAGPYVIALLIFSILFLVAAKIAARTGFSNGIPGRLAELGRGKGLPYAVPMALAFVFAIGLTQFVVRS